MNINKVNLLDYKGGGGRSLVAAGEPPGFFLEAEGGCLRTRRKKNARRGLRVEGRGGFCTLSPLSTCRKVGGTDRFKPRRVPERGDAPKGPSSRRGYCGESRDAAPPLVVVVFVFYA